MRVGLALVLVAACGSHPPPAEVTNTAPVGADPIPGDEPIQFEVGGVHWMLAVPGVEHTVPDQYTHRFATAAWTIDVVEWPDSSVFIQTLAEELAAEHKTDPGVVVLDQQDHPPGWSLVTQTRGKISGGVFVTSELVNVMCTFELAVGSNWRDALDACNKIQYRPGAELAPER